MVRTEPMTHLDCLATICELAQSQGFYGRMLHHLHELHVYSPAEYDEIMADWDEQQFKNSVEFILYLET